LNALVSLGAFFLAIFLLVVIHESGHFLVARALKVRVLRFSFGFGPVLACWKDKRGTAFVFSLLPLGGYVKLWDAVDEVCADSTAVGGMALNEKPLWGRALIVFAGPLFNFLFAVLAFWLVGVIGIRPMTVSPHNFSTTIEKVMPGTPAEKAGLLPGDRLQAMDHKKIVNWQAFVRAVQQRPAESIQLTFIRHAHKETRALVVGEKIEEGRRIGFLGLYAKSLGATLGPLYRERPLRALQTAVEQTTRLTALSFSLFGDLVTGKLSLNQVSGPVGIAAGAGHSAQGGLAYYLYFLALVSISLGVLNLLPIPLLDGGYLLFYTLEALTRRTLPQGVKAVGFLLGIGLLVSLTGIALHNDLHRLGWLH